MFRARIIPLMLASAGLALGGCVNRDKSDLEDYVAQVLSRKGGQIEPLPPIKPYERYLYQSADRQLRDPFTPFMQLEAQREEIAPAADAAQQALTDEITAHNREELENFELDSLRMVGTLRDDSELWGIVRDSGGIVHRVQIGNYMGRNFGKILDIQEDRIELREIVKDGDGRWEERQASLALLEE